ncbi:hypothetical protein Plec18170_005211 [Paecilomyces lecythidis]
MTDPSEMAAQASHEETDRPSRNLVPDSYLGMASMDDVMLEGPRNSPYRELDWARLAQAAYSLTYRTLVRSHAFVDQELLQIVHWLEYTSSIVVLAVIETETCAQSSPQTE